MSGRMSRFTVYAALVALALGSVASGRFAIALALAGLKALMVGLEYMELRHAHRAHLAAFAGWVLTVVVALGITLAACSR